MRPGLVCLLWTPLLLAQGQQQDPFDASVQACWMARGSGHFEEAAKLREEARRLLAGVPVDSPQFGQRARTVAQLYDNGAMSSQARAILEQSLARTGRSPAGQRTRVSLLFALADSWEQDRNLLKAVNYREQGIAEFEKLPPAEPNGSAMMLSVSGRLSCFSYAPQSDGMQEYLQLANLYRQLGRPQDVSRLIETIRSRSSSEDTLALLYEQDGRVDEAAALYKRQAEGAVADPAKASAALQSLARLYQNQQQFTEAASALRQAVNVLSSSERPEIRDQAIWVRQNLAMVLNQAGQTEAADQTFEQLLAGTEHGQNGMRTQVLASYANHLASTKRASQAETLLKDQLANQADMQPWEESNLLSSLATVARMSGDEAGAQAYQRTAEEKQRAAQFVQPTQVQIGADLQQAQVAANAGHYEEAIRLATRAIDAAPEAVDREQLSWTVPSVASALAAKLPAASDALYGRLFESVESWSAETVQPLLNTWQNYARYLMQQQRWREVHDATERYRTVLVAARSEGTGWLEDVLRLRLEAARGQSSHEVEIAVATELLALEEGLSGATSEPYLHAVEAKAEAFDATGDGERSLPLRRQAVSIVDLVSPQRDPRRGYTRMNAAFALARARQFDEAERLAAEAVALAGTMRPPQPNVFEPQLDQIRQMKAAALSQPAATAGNRWFESKGFISAPAQPQRSPDLTLR